VLCGYRVPITFTGLSADKAPIVLGPFSRNVELTTDVEGLGKLEVRVTGRTAGVVEVGLPRDRGVLSLGEFDKRTGKQGSIVLRGPASGVAVELDEGRTKKAAPLLKVTLSSPQSEGGEQTWTLQVGVPPKAASGRLRGKSVYLTVREQGKPARTIRVPVAGDAQ
jgi:hypothetical protein